MGLRGQLAQPNIIQIMKGDPGKRAKRNWKTEPKPKEFKSCPEPPEWMSEEQKAVHERYARNLWEIGLLTVVDYDAFCDYCAARALMDGLRKEMASKGIKPMVANAKGMIETSPVVKTFVELEKILGKYERVFGLTPSTRVRINQTVNTQGGGGDNARAKRVLGYD